MYQFFVEPDQINTNDKSVIIIGDDVNHIKNVLRMRPGEEIAVSNGVDGKEYRCGIISLDADRVVCKLRFVKEDGVELPAKVYLFQGLPKADKMEWIVQKAVELGAYEIIPVMTKRSVVKLDERKAASRTKRWQGIAEAAAKQSKRAIIPRVGRVCSFSQAVAMASDMNVRIIPYEMAERMDETRRIIDTVQPGQSIAVFIGPEGGFEETEIQEAVAGGIVPVTLGKRILRTETAGMTVLAWMMYRLDAAAEDAAAAARECKIIDKH